MCLLLAQLIIGFFSIFLLRLFTVLMKKTRAVKQSIILRCLWPKSFTHFIFVNKQTLFETYEWVQKASVLRYTRQERLARDIDASLLDSFITTKKIKCCEYDPCWPISGYIKTCDIRHAVYILNSRWPLQIFRYFLSPSTSEIRTLDLRIMVRGSSTVPPPLATSFL